MVHPRPGRYRRVPTGRAWPRTARRYCPHMQKWEYLTAPLLVHNTKMILDNFGEEGWELVAIVPGPNPENLVAYFKRPKAG